MTLFKSQFSKILKPAIVSAALMGATLTGVQAGDFALKYATEDLATTQGVAKVHTQIKRVAKENCPSYAEIHSVSEVNACVTSLTRELVDKIGNASLSAYHSGDTSVRVAERVRVADKMSAQAPNPS